MPFRHFHRHSKKYLLVFLIATLFSLLAFNITDALQSAAASMFGGTGGRYLAFKTINGREVGVEQGVFDATRYELPGAVDIYRSSQMQSRFDPFAQVFDPYAGVGREDLPLLHLMLLSDADEMKLALPPENAERLVEKFKENLQRQFPDFTRGQWSQLLRNVRLTEETLLQRLGEILKVEAYVRAMKGVPVVDPARTRLLFVERHMKVGLDYVEFPFEKYKEELKASPPSDADLETWFKGLSADVIEEEFTRQQRFSLDLVTVDADAWDPASVPAELMPAVPELTDEDVLREVRKDPKRHALETPPTKIEEVTAETRARVKKDQQLKAVLEKLRADFDAAIAALPAVDTTKTEEEQKAAKAERIVKENEAFAQVVTKYGLPAPKNFVDQEAKLLAEIDPPKDMALQYIAPGLVPPASTSGGLRTQSALPARDRKWAYVVRLTDDPKPTEPKPFAEVKEQALERYVEDHAKERALAKAKELVAAFVAEAEKALPEAVKTAFRAEIEADVKRAENAMAAGAELTDEMKKSAREQAESVHFMHVQSALKGAAGAKFADVARGLGLEVKSIAPQRRSVQSTPYFNDRFSGAERFLLRQYDEDEASLLGYSEGTVSPLLVNDADKAAYVAKVASRQEPSLEEMTPKDRQDIERFEKFRRPVVAPYANPFSMAEMVRTHEPKVLPRGSAQQYAGPYGY